MCLLPERHTRVPTEGSKPFNENVHKVLYFFRFSLCVFFSCVCVFFFLVFVFFVLFCCVRFCHPFFFVLCVFSFFFCVVSSLY